MKMKFKALILFTYFLISSMLIFSHAINKELTSIPNVEHQKDIKIAQNWILNYIHIDDNWSDIALNYGWCNGNGSWNNPYIIENVTIDVSGSPTGSGIIINNTKSDYFIIRNCTVFNAATGLYDAGIKFENTSIGSIVNCHIFNNNRYGIFLHKYCMNNTISTNIISNNIGIALNINCTKNTILDNNILSNRGILLIGNSSNNYIRKNVINEGLFGIQIELSDDNQIINNVISYHSSHGILINGDRNNVTSNYFYKNKIAIDINYDANIIDNNVIVNDQANLNYKIEDWDFGTNTIIGFNYYLPTKPKLCLNILEQSFSATKFINTINISSSLNFDLWIQSLHIWWNGITVPSNDIVELENGLYNISLSPKFVDEGDSPILLNITVRSATHEELYYESLFEVSPYEIPNLIHLNIVDQTFLSTKFNITIFVYDNTLNPIDNAIFQVWWNTISIHINDINNLGNGLYSVSVSPITVSPGDDPILLNMTITAFGYEDKYFETYIAIDPKSINKGPYPPTNHIWLNFLMALFYVGLPTISVILIIIFIMKKRKG